MAVKSPIRRPTLIILGLGEAGQQILYHVGLQAHRLGIIERARNTEVEKAKVQPLRPVHVKKYLEKRIESLKERLEEALGEGTLSLPREVDMLRRDFTEPPRPVKEAAGADSMIDALMNPLVSSYGISMIRIDVDERTLESIARGFLEKGLPVPPGIALASETTSIYDPVLGKTVALSPTGGSHGRSGAVYQLLKSTESNVVLDLLGIPSKTLTELAEKSEEALAQVLGEIPTAIPSYRTFILIHGLLGTGPGVSAAILEALEEVGNRDVLEPKFKIDFTIIPSAEELKLGRLDPPSWLKVIRWNLERLLEYLNAGILDTVFIVDLDFAGIQYLKNSRILRRDADEIRRTNLFIKRILDGEIGLYNEKELRKYSGLNPGNLAGRYGELDPLVAYSLEPVIVVHGPRDRNRGLQFAVGGSSVDEMEIKEMMKGFAVVPLVATLNIFDVYLEIERRAVERDVDAPDEASLATLMLPVLHGPLAPLVRDMAKGFIVVINRVVLERLMDTFDYIPSPSDIADLLREIFTRRASVKVLVSKNPLSTSVVIHALLDPEEYINHVVDKKGWT